MSTSIGGCSGLELTTVHVLQVLLILNDEREIIRAARTFLITLLALYVARETPALNSDQLKGYPENVDESYWTKIKVDLIPKVCDEHYYKLVQVRLGLSFLYNIHPFPESKLLIFFVCVVEF